MLYHIDPLTLKLVECGGCSAIPAQAHYSSKEEANAAIEWTKGLNKIALESKELFFTRAWSEKTCSEFLEASLRTPFGEDALFTVESTLTDVRGTLYLEEQEYMLASINELNTNDGLERVAKMSVRAAQRYHRLDIWPSESVVKLYDSLQSNSTACELISPLLQLHEIQHSSSTQFYLGETFTGVKISVKVAYGYVIAEIDSGDGPKIVHEASLPQRFFLTERERNIFTAKAFGELLESGSI